MEMTFRDDECRVQTDHALANFNTIALNLICRGKGNPSVNLARYSAARDNELLVRLVKGYFGRPSPLTGVVCLTSADFLQSLLFQEDFL